MTIHKYLHKIVMACAALFWAGCDDNSVKCSVPDSMFSGDSSSSAENTSSSFQAISSSVETLASSSSVEKMSSSQESSSSEVPASSSINSWTSDRLFPSGKVVLSSGLKLARDTSAKCDLVADYDDMRCKAEGGGTPSTRDCSWYYSVLSKEGYFFADSLKAYKEAYMDCYYLAQPEYGCDVVPSKKYKCDNGVSFSDGYVIEGDILMDFEEYRDYLNRDIVTADSAEGRIFTCAHENAISIYTLRSDIKKELFEKVVALLDSGELSLETKACLENKLNNKHTDFKYDAISCGGYASGSVFENQKCPDGTIIETEEYRAVYDEYKSCAEKSVLCDLPLEGKDSTAVE